VGVKDTQGSVPFASRIWFLCLFHPSWFGLLCLLGGSDSGNFISPPSFPKRFAFSPCEATPCYLTGLECVERRQFALLALNAFQVFCSLKALADTISIKVFPVVSFLWGEVKMFSICLAGQVDGLSWRVTVQVASNNRDHSVSCQVWVSAWCSSPVPACWCWDAELLVLVFPRRASKPGAYLDGASSSHAQGSHRCQMWGQESLSACWNTNRVGFAPSEVYCHCKGSWQYFCSFYFFSAGLYLVDLKNALWCWEIFCCMSLWKKRDFFFIIIIGCFASSSYVSLWEQETDSKTF